MMVTEGRRKPARCRMNLCTLAAVKKGQCECKPGDAIEMIAAEAEEVEAAPLLLESSLRVVQRGPPSTQPTSPRRHVAFRSLFFLYITAGLDSCDDQLLPASFKALETDLQFGPATLGTIALVQTLCFALFSPLSGTLADTHSRPIVLATGCMCWGVTTLALATIAHLWAILLMRALNGVALASVSPITQSLLSDIFQRDSYGLAFGLIHLSQCIGRLVGGVYTTSISNLNIMGTHVTRLRLACGVCIGGHSESAGGADDLHGAGDVPRRTLPHRKLPSRPPSIPAAHDEGSAPGDEGDGSQQLPRRPTQYRLAEALSYFRLPTICVIVIQGMFSHIPWSAISFIVMFLQYCRLEDFVAAAVLGAVLMTAAAAGPLGGYLGDMLYKLSADHGRIYLGQIGIAIKVPASCILLLFIPRQPTSLPWFVLLGLMIGISAGWAGVAVIRPLLAEVVQSDYRATVFSWCSACDITAAALLGAPLVGILSENVFGYEKTTQKIADMDERLRERNAAALGKALFCTTTVPWAVCFVLYSLLHYTYPRDRVRSQETCVQRRAWKADKDR
ncbi:unnamed protein product [Vitrella brassicaformis CCMP3155]|uniref:Major facilitator superfamily (MFS) profile domain-containing protein n=3 Tax=Vitrella brassicaformis TaxID=1169539 RepID=A0A0G4FF15_VITBC|nr:unnamed protein product [Vitrella brassicaformis CCMP3155]|eukprot:CEM11781.1 unnamed protein product [Vitrella brassicaformis CCMP3155]